MVDNPGTSLHYMCIVQTSSVSTAACIDHQVFMVSFLNEMNYFATLVGLFFNKTYRTTYFTYQKSPCKRFFNVLSMFQINQS